MKTIQKNLQEFCIFNRNYPSLQAVTEWIEGRKENNKNAVLLLKHKASTKRGLLQALDAYNTQCVQRHWQVDIEDIDEIVELFIKSL